MSQINRDTANALNKLDHIFDKKTIEEKQELAKLFAKNGNELIHKVSEHYGWADGDANKVALHTLIGGLTAQIAGGDFSSGAWAAGVNEQLSKEILKLADGDPAKAQLYSAVVGIAVNSILEEDTETGAAVSQYGMKWNHSLIDEFKGFVSKNYEQVKANAMNEARDLVASGKFTPGNMEYDYYIVTYSKSGGKGLAALFGGSFSVLVDKYANVYAMPAWNPSLGFGVPVTTGAGWASNIMSDTPEGYREAIAGLGGSFGGFAGYGGNIGINTSLTPTVELTSAAGVGISLTVGYVFYVGNLNDYV